MSKPRVIKDYDKLDDAIRQQVKLVYPRGFAKHLVAFKNKDGERQLGLPFETEDYYYLIRMTENKARAIILNDDDYDDTGKLKKEAKLAYEDKFADLDYLDNNANDDNDFDIPSDELGDDSDFDTSDEDEDDDK